MVEYPSATFHSRVDDWPTNQWVGHTVEVAADDPGHRRRHVTWSVTGTSTVAITAAGGEAVTAGSWRITTVNRRRRR